MNSTQAKRNRAKGGEFERYVVTRAQQHGLDAVRLGHGQSNPEYPYADVLIEGIGHECKCGKQVRAWMQNPASRASKPAPGYLLNWLSETGAVILHGHGWEYRDTVVCFYSDGMLNWYTLDEYLNALAATKRGEQDA